MLTSTGKFHQTLAVIPGMLLAFVIGMGCGWVGPMIPFLKKSSMFGITITQASWIASLHYIGKIFGSLLTGSLLNVIGRQYLFLISSILSASVWLSVYYGNVVTWLYLSRVVYGITAGIYETVVPIYITENCSPGIRGVFCCLVTVCFFAGVTIEYVIAEVCSSYHMIASINLVTCILSVIISLTLTRETPQYLLMKGKEMKAKKRYEWLQASNEHQTEERFLEFQKNISERKTGLSILQILKDPENRTGLRVVLIINILSMLTGYTGVNNFITTTFLEFKNPSAEMMTILYGSSSLIALSFTSFGFDKVERRKALMTASFICFNVHFLFAFIQYLHLQGVQILYYKWVLLICNSIYGIMFSTVICPIFVIIKGELLSQNAKASGSSMAVIVNSLVSFLVAKSFLHVAQFWGYYSNFFFYSIASLVLLIYVYFDMPETRGKSLVAIQFELKKRDTLSKQKSNIESINVT